VVDGVRLALLLLISACTTQMAEDALRTPQERCEEARALYHDDPNPKALALALAVCTAR
jgi:hypothetical protein